MGYREVRLLWDAIEAVEEAVAAIHANTSTRMKLLTIVSSLFVIALALFFLLGR